MWRSKALFQHPEDDPELVFAGLSPQPRARRGVGIPKAPGLRIAAITEPGFNASTTLTSASGKRKSTLNRLSLPLSAVVGTPLPGRLFHSRSPQHRVRASIMPHRKSSRYEAAHRALLDRSGKLPPETSPEVLKIQTLERATAFLRVQIQETQEYREKIRQCLADRDTQLREYQVYQREKWRTDRRLAALMVLTEPVRAAPQAAPKNTQCETTSSPARKRANLSSFFQRGSCKAPLRFKCAVTGKALERRVLKQVSPLLLRPLASPTRVHFHPVPDDLPPLYARRRQPGKMINTQEGLWPFPSISYSVTEDASTSDLSPDTLPDDSVGTTREGIALIHSPILRSEEEIIAEMGDVTLPAYALDLLDDLDYIHDKIPLQPGSPPSDVFSSALLVTSSDWDSPRLGHPITSPGRTATVRIPDRHLADALLTSPETERAPHRRGRSHKVSLDPTIFKDDSKLDKLRDVAPIRHSSHVTTEEARRKPRGLLRKKSSGVFSLVSRSSDRREEHAMSTHPKSKSIASMVRRRMSAINKFR